MPGTSFLRVMLKFQASLSVCGVQSLPSGWVDGDGSRFVQTLRDNYVAEGAVQPGNFNHVEALIRPVNVPCLSGKENRKEKKIIHRHIAGQSIISFNVLWADLLSSQRWCPPLAQCRWLPRPPSRSGLVSPCWWCSGPCPPSRWCHSLWKQSNSHLELSFGPSTQPIFWINCSTDGLFEVKMRTQTIKLPQLLIKNFYDLRKSTNDFLT